MLSPCFERLLALREKLVALVYGCNSRDRDGLVIENLICNVRCEPESSHPGYTGPTQIMKSPSGHTRQLIQPAFGSTESREGVSSKKGENIRPTLVCVRQHGHRLLGQVYEMGLGVLWAASKL